MSPWFTFHVGAGWWLALVALLVVARGRSWLSIATHPRAVAVIAPASRWLAQVVGRRDRVDDAFFDADGASAAVVDARRQALHRLSQRFAAAGPRSRAITDAVRGGFSDLRFADANRVPFPFAKRMRESFQLAAITERSEGPWLIDADGERSIDVSGSYGVNVAGYEAYKRFIDEGWALTRDSGVVLGPLHPLVAENVATLKQISGCEEISFHMSGTEAVMAAVRMARFNTQRRYIVTFSGAYHGWWDGVQPGVGNERPLDDCIPLNEMTPATLAVIRARAHEIAAVLVNPIQSFHPNSPPPSDAVLLSSELRTTQTDNQYGRWLKELAQTCKDAAVPLIFDEVFSGFRLAPGGAQEYFDVRADMVVYGKTVAGGMPIGVVCGPHRLMQRFDPDHPMRLAYVVGTFSAHPLTMGAMRAFLNWATSDAGRDEYKAADRVCAQWVEDTNRDLIARELPVRVARFTSIFTLLFTQPGRFNWLLQYYLRAEGVNLSWVGTGRCMTSLDYSVEDYKELRNKIVAAVAAMQADQWWLEEATHPDRKRTIQQRVRQDMIQAVLPVPSFRQMRTALRAFYQDIMQRKHDDHEASHSHRVNQAMHMVSSTVFLICYIVIFFDLPLAMWLGLASLFLRQAGHALIEPPCHDKEQLLLGFDTKSKTVIVTCYLLIPAINLLMAPNHNPGWLAVIADHVAVQWFAFTVLVVLGRVAVLARRHGLRNALIWFLKLITDPITDVSAYHKSLLPAR